MSLKLLHATCVALDGHGGPFGVLLRGPSGAGKSDLALRLIDRGARLVADDQCEVVQEERAAGPRLIARAPAEIAGALEVRGLGITEVPSLGQVPVALIVDLVPPEAVERLPEAAREEILGVDLPRLALNAFEAAAPAKLDLALRRLADPATQHDPAPAPEPGGPRPLVLVTGLSGAGRSTALKILEDLGYEAIDNLPLDLLQPLIAGGRRSVALGIDIRTRGFAVGPLFLELARDMNGAGLRLTLLFVDCDDTILARRYTETRRRHPLARGRPVTDGIAAERTLLSPLRARADLVIDTSALAPAELRHILAGHFKQQGADGMAVCVTSFAYRNGLPREADLVFDVRFLQNPHYEPELRPLTGRDEAVDRFIAADPRLEPFFAKLTDLLASVLSDYRNEGKTYLTIALGCTGGRHRSVAIAERLAAWFAAQGEPVTLLHRDLEEVRSGRPEGP